jgi:ribosomal protein L40E
MHTTETATETSTTYTHVLSTTTLTETTTWTSSAQVTQTITILANPFAEAATALLVLAAVATLLVPRIRARRLTSKVCPQCGYNNPPYAHSFCIKCGNSLEAPKT